MSYRLPEDRKPEYQSHISDTASKTIISVDNGTISRISIPAFFSDYHSKMIHDHFGWPTPDHPDDSCQLPPGCDIVFNDVDLEYSGYDTVEIAMVDPPDGLTFTGSIDYNLINLTITAMCESAKIEDVDVTFAIYISGLIDNDYDEEDIPVRDAVTKGTLHIVAGLI